MDEQVLYNKLAPIPNELPVSTKFECLMDVAWPKSSLKVSFNLISYSILGRNNDHQNHIAKLFQIIHSDSEYIKKHLYDKEPHS
jgi:hypothetical protein